MPAKKTETPTTPPTPEAEAPVVPQAAGSLDGALLEAQRLVKAVAKRGEGRGYKYATAEDVIAEGREALNEAGLVHSWSALELEPLAEPVRVSEKTTWGHNLHVQFRLAHPASGEVRTTDVTMPVVWQAAKPPDKSTMSALTEARSYYLQGLLSIIRADEHGISGRDDSREQDWRGQRQRPQGRPSGPRPQGGGSLKVDTPEAYLNELAREGDPRLAREHRALFGDRPPSDLGPADRKRLADRIRGVAPGPHPDAERVEPDPEAAAQGEPEEHEDEVPW